MGVIRLKGIILAGGAGTRLLPMTSTSSKQLLPIFDKPMVYYPMTILMLSGIKEILVISTPNDIDDYKNLLGEGDSLGITVEYSVQHRPSGLAQALIIGEEFLGGECCALILGDNLFHGRGISHVLQRAASVVEKEGGAHLFASMVPDPSRFGIATLDEKGGIIRIVEKPEEPETNLAVTGLYMYDGTASARARKIQPSSRGELEITDLNMSFVEENKAILSTFDRGITWLDTGTPESLHSASSYVQAVQSNTGSMIACIEEVAWRMGLIDDSELANSVKKYPAGNKYGDYVRSLVG